MPSGNYPDVLPRGATIGGKKYAKGDKHPAAGLSKNKFLSDGTPRPPRKSRSKLAKVKEEKKIEKGVDLGIQFEARRNLLYALTEEWDFDLTEELELGDITQEFYDLAKETAEMIQQVKLGVEIDPSSIFSEKAGELFDRLKELQDINPYDDPTPLETYTENVAERAEEADEEDEWVVKHAPSTIGKRDLIRQIAERESSAIGGRTQRRAGRSRLGEYAGRDPNMLTTPEKDEYAIEERLIGFGSLQEREGFKREFEKKALLEAFPDMKGLSRTFKGVNPLSIHTILKEGRDRTGKEMPLEEAQAILGEREAVVAKAYASAGIDPKAKFSYKGAKQYRDKDVDLDAQSEYRDPRIVARQGQLSHLLTVKGKERKRARRSDFGKKRKGVQELMAEKKAVQEDLAQQRPKEFTEVYRPLPIPKDLPEQLKDKRSFQTQVYSGHFSDFTYQSAPELVGASTKYRLTKKGKAFVLRAELPEIYGGKKLDPDSKFSKTNEVIFRPVEMPTNDPLAFDAKSIQVFQHTRPDGTVLYLRKGKFELDANAMISDTPLLYKKVNKRFIKVKDKRMEAIMEKHRAEKGLSP